MFGIAVDPGPDFIENLYRCGYGLADVHMIVLTHDHADHIVSLDSMLALMGIRKGLGDDTFGLANPPTEEVGRRLAIVGNESVCRRYSFYNCEEHPTPRDGKPKTRIDAVRVLNFGEIDWVTQQKGQARKEAIEEKEILLKPETLRIEPVKTWGHADANGFVSQGFLLSVGEDEDRSSILITGDTGRPSNLGGGGGEPHESHRLAGGSKSLRKAVKEADVVVAHLSSVPLRELRQLAELDSAGDNEAIAEFSELWARAVERATESEPDGHSADYAKGIEQTEFLLNQIQFGFRSKPADPTDGFTVSPFSDIEKIKDQPDQHLYLMGLLEVAEAMAMHSSRPAPLLLIGELREELGTFRTRIASQIAEEFFAGEGLRPSALTTDIGLRVRLCGPANDKRAITVLCTTCDLDNDLIPVERFHRPREIREVCVKGEDEGVFYNCSLHSPREQDDYLWLEQVERYDVFGDQSQAGPGST
jgi:hypothetical protein